MYGEITYQSESVLLQWMMTFMYSKAYFLLGVVITNQIWAL